MKKAEDINEQLGFSDIISHSTLYNLFKLAVEDYTKTEELIQEARKA